MRAHARSATEPVGQTRTAAPIRVFVVDDHAVVRQGLGRLIERADGMVMCGEADSPDEALERLTAARPDVLVTDLTLASESGLSLIEAVRQRHPDLAVLVLTVHEESLFAARALALGARGYVMKTEPTLRVLDGIRAVARGEPFLSADASRRLLEGLANGGGGHRIADPDAILTARDRQVLELIGRGLRSVDIARELGIAVNTVERYRARLRRKLHLRDALELVRFAFQWTGSEESNGHAARRAAS